METETNALLQTLLQTIIIVFVPVLGTLATIALQRLSSQIKGKVGEQNYSLAENLAYQFVLAAEQSGLSGAIKDEAAVKKEWAMSQLDGALRAKGIKLDLPVLSALIEAKVHETFKLDIFSEEPAELPSG